MGRLPLGGLLLLRQLLSSSSIAFTSLIVNTRSSVMPGSELANNKRAPCLTTAAAEPDVDTPSLVGIVHHHCEVPACILVPCDLLSLRGAMVGAGVGPAKTDSVKMMVCWLRPSMMLVGSYYSGCRDV